MDRPLDLIVFGATGFTGRLVAEFLQSCQGADLALPLPLLTANAAHAGALAALVARTHAVIT